jgi:hypothetical protein
LDAAQQFTDIPSGYKVLPPAAPLDQFSDVPDGYKVLPPKAPTAQQSSAAIGRVTSPLSPAPIPPASLPPFSLGAPPSTPRSTAEGLTTEQQERRAGMPLAIQPASGSLENTHPEQVVAQPLTNQTLATPPKPAPIDTSLGPNAPFTPEEVAARHQEKQADEAADSSMLANYSRAVEAGRRMGSKAGEQIAALGTPIEKGYGDLTDENRGAFEKEHPAAAGIGKAAGGFVGQMAADPVTYLFMGSSELAHPMLDRIISSGFRFGLGVHAVNAARDLQKNWNDYTPEKRYEVATEAGLSGLLAAGAHQIRDFLKGPYEALPTEPTERAESLFRNLVHKAGGTVGENPTLEEANAAYRSAIANLHPDVNPEAAEDARNLNDAWAKLKQSGRFTGKQRFSDVPEGYRILPPAAGAEQPTVHASNDVEELRASAERQAPKIGDAVSSATEGVPGTKLEAVRDSKDSDRITDKAERQGVEPSQIKDIAAAKVTVPDQEAANQVLENLHPEMPVEEVNGMVTGEPGKNAVRQTQAVVSTDQPGEPVKNAEVLLQTPEMHKATETTHDDYRKAQELRAAGKEAEAQAVENRIAGEHEEAHQAAIARQEESNAIQERSAEGVHGSAQEEDGGQRSQHERVGERQQGQGSSAARPQAARQEKEEAPRAPKPPTRGVSGANDLTHNLKNQAIEIRDSQGNWKQGTVLADSLTQGGDRPRRLRGTFADGTEFDNIKLSDVRRPEVQTGSEGIDFDGTLFTERPDGSIGEPIPERIASLKERIANGEEVVIESHRARQPGGVSAIQDALEKAGLPRLPVSAKKNVEPTLVDDEKQNAPGVTQQKVATNRNTPLPDVPRAPRPPSYGPPKKDFQGSVPAESLGFNHTIDTGPDIGAKARVETEKRMGGPLPRGQAERRAPEPKPVDTSSEAIKAASNPERDTDIMAKLKEEHPDWSLSQRLQEAAKLANPPKEKPVEISSKDVSKPVPQASEAGKKETVQVNQGAGGADKVGPGTKGEIAPGKVGEMKVADLKVAPNKFQYKLGTDAAGTSTLLKEAKTFNPDLAGTISVWKDPADGKTYVVNGHHRYELAKRTGQDEVAVRHIVAQDAAEARAVGARQNIAEGRGTPVDAAKFFRDTSITPEDLDKHGISLGEATAAKGLALSNLDDSLFSKVVNGDLREGRAVAIGEATKDPAEQKAILSLLERKERIGAKVSDDTLSELIRLVKGAEQKTETTANLFGTQEINRSLALEKAEISAHIKQQLSKDKKLFGFVAKEGRAEELARAGNKIDVEKSKEISTGAAQAEEVYNKLSARGGPIATILDEAARKLADREGSPASIKSDAYERIREEVSQTLRGTEREVPERMEAGAGPSKEVEPTLPGMEHVPAERAEAVSEQQGKDLTAKLTEPPKSIESKAGEIEQRSPLFRDTEANPQKGLFGGESGSLDISKLSPSHIKQQYDQAVSEFISGKLKIGDKYHDVAKHDETVANTLHLVDNAPRYFKAKADANLKGVTAGLNDDQIRLASMMADSDSRDYLKANKPDEFKQATSDPAVMAAVKKFEPLQQELTKDRQALGWPVRMSMEAIEQPDGTFKVMDRSGADLGDFKTAKKANEFIQENGEVEPHLKRTYPEHSKNPLPAETGVGDFTQAFPHEKGLRPPKMDKKSREMSAEYHYEHGRKDFSGYTESFKQTKTAVLKQKLFDDFVDRATPYSAGTAQPPKIEYNGKTYYRPDIVQKAKEGGTKLESYAMYDPTRGEKFMIANPEEGWATLATGKSGIKASDRFLGPKPVVDAMENYDTSRGGESSKLRHFFQEQIVGLFGPVVHINNIVRRIGQATGMGTFDPRSWPSIARVIASPELRQRVMSGVDDATIDMLTKYGAYTDWGDIGTVNKYIGGNLNPASWVRSFGKGVLFDPKFAKGWGGLDPKARVVVADYFKEHFPKMTDAEVAKAIEDGFGNYNRANWTERQRLLAKFTLFPGWDAASAKWFLRHPFRAGVAGSLVVLAINRALNALGKNKDQDANDLSYVHFGDRKLSSGLIMDNMGNHFMSPVLGALQAKLSGDDVAAGATEGAQRGSAALAGTLAGPVVEMVADQIYNRKYAGGASELVKPEDKYTPGTWLPNVELEKRAAFAALKGTPALNRFINPKGEWDWAQGIGGGVLGVTNYKYGAEERFKANVAKAATYGQTLNQLAMKEPEAAAKFASDPQRATYLMFHDDLEQMARDLKELDSQIERVRSADLPHTERQSILEDLKNNRNTLLKAADGLNDALNEAKNQSRKKQTDYWKSKVQ